MDVTQKFRKLVFGEEYRNVSFDLAVPAAVEVTPVKCTAAVLSASFMIGPSAYCDSLVFGMNSLLMAHEIGGTRKAFETPMIAKAGEAPPSSKAATLGIRMSMK